MDEKLQLIEDLEKEWDRDEGFFGQLRSGIFDPGGVDRVLELLHATSSTVDESDVINRRIVSLTWFIPRFMSWQQERVAEQGGNVADLNAAINAIESVLYKILGVP